MSVFERWHPIQHDMGLIKAPCKEVVDAFQMWKQCIGQLSSIKNINSSLQAAFEALQPLSVELRRALFVPTSSEWTAFFQSGISGSDPSPPMSVLSKKMSVMAMRVCSTHKSAKYSANIWEVYDPFSQNGYGRSIYASNDGGKWVFGQSGVPYKFESTDSYHAKLKRDRFNRDMFESYLSEFKLYPFNEQFYRVEKDAAAIIVEKTARWDSLPNEYTIEEVLNGLPYKRSK
jgi:hypothetical protein